MAYQKGLVATLAELEMFYKDQPVIELMNQTNDVLSDIPWMEANQTDGHVTRIRTGLPEIHWRRLYKGVPPSKASVAQVKEICGMMEAIQNLDVKELELYGDKANAFRLSEGKAFTEAMRQKVAATLFYGDNNVNPDEFNGLAMRFPSKSSPNVVDAGGTTKDKETSIWLIKWGADTVHGIYPKGSTGGLKHESAGPSFVQDTNGNPFRAVSDIYSWNCGLALRDWRAGVRICNIDVTKLGKKKGETGYIDFHSLMIEAKNKMPAYMRAGAIWYCNSSVMTALEQQASDSGNVQLVYGENFKSQPVPIVHGLQVHQCDAIVLTESVLA